MISKTSNLYFTSTAFLPKYLQNVRVSEQAEKRMKEGTQHVTHAASTVCLPESRHVVIRASEGAVGLTLLCNLGGVRGHSLAPSGA